MNRALVLLVTAALMTTGCATTCTQRAGAACKGEEPVLRHVVLFKFKDETTAEQVRAIEQGFCDLSDKIDVVKDFEWGTDVSSERLTDGFTHCFVVTFADEAGRDAYLPHPAHKEFVEFLKPHLDKVLAIDFKPQH